MKKTLREQLGFTLIEMMMVLIIMSVIVVMIANYTTIKSGQIRRDRAALQMQQILNAGLAYYVNNANWPGWTTTSTTCSGTSSTTNALQVLQAGSYLPATLNSPYIAHPAYTVSCNSTANAVSGTFNVSLVVSNAQDAAILAGEVPMGTVTSGNTVTSQVNIPGQNLNNARSVNFAGIYHPGACVPVPVCPTNMQPQIFVSIAQVMGTNDATSPPNVYPLTNFSAYAVGPSAAGSSQPPNCNSSGSSACYQSGSTLLSATSTSQFWRICIDVATEDGEIDTSSNSGSGSSSWAQYQTLFAVTRCAPQAEYKQASDMTVWSTN